MEDDYMLKEKIMKAYGTVKLGAKRNAPELLLAGGIITGTAAMVTMNKAGVKAIKATNSHKETMEQLSALEHIEGLPMDVDHKNLVKKAYVDYAKLLVEAYAIPVGLYATSVAMIFASYKIQKNRQVGLSMALASVTKAYNELNNRLKNGAATGLTAKEVLEGIQAREVVDEETGEVTIEKYQVEGLEDPGTVRFDRYSTQWTSDKYQNGCTLYSEQDWANNLLRLQGHLFLNDVYSRLGIPVTKAGQVLGWVWEKDESIFVDFNIKDCSDYEDVRYDDNAFDLTLNVQGDILTNF